MFKTEGSCDWCKKQSLLIRHDYVDGRFHHSCEDCQDLAKFDVNLFNIDELALRKHATEA
ncbi:hypothetical protein [Vibrio sp. HN007]|uniref:hypothetical protein n=1 Tax=Vibrio iocasae TaxID=3098914 RepID=UPI0035D46134